MCTDHIPGLRVCNGCLKTKGVHPPYLIKDTMSEYTSTKSFVDKYHKQALKNISILLVSVIGVIIVTGLFSVSVYDDISLIESYQIIIDHIRGVEHEFRSQEWWADRYIWNMVIPRIVAALLAGISLSAAGALMQALMNNPLADPYSTGISSGAAFGAIAALVTGLTINGMQGGMIISAFVGSMVPVGIVILISKKMPLSPAALILVGTALSYFFNSMVTYMLVMTDVETLQTAYIWQIGSFESITWDSIPLMAVATLICSIIVLILSKKLNIMSLGDANAKSLGLDVEKFRLICLIVMAVMTASIVCFTGTIGFLGLVAPHLVRIVVGSDNKFVVPISMALGAFILLLADYVALSTEVTVGTIMSMIGAPLFFILIVWQRKGYGAIY